MSGIRELFKKRKVLNCYLTAGYPDIPTFEKILLALSCEGTDIIEVGLPFSDPIADGDTIQKASVKVLDKGMNIESVARCLKRLKGKIGSKLLFMTYYNPVFAYGEDRFIRLALECGVSGVIVPDLPYEEGRSFYRKCARKGLDTVLLVTPVTPMKRVKAVSRFTTGFLYFVSVLGTTGQRTRLPRAIIRNLKEIKKEVSLPVCLGFGIKSAGVARPFVPYVDGIIVGSAFIDLVSRFFRNKKQLFRKIAVFVRSLRRVLDEK